MRRLDMDDKTCVICFIYPIAAGMDLDSGHQAVYVPTTIFQCDICVAKVLAESYSGK